MKKQDGATILSLAWLVVPLSLLAGAGRAQAAVAVVVGTAAVTATTAPDAEPDAPAVVHRPARRGAGHVAPPAAVPAANFRVEWRIQAVNAAASHGDVVITSGSAAIGGSSGFGPGAVVVGTARAAVPQAVSVSNGKVGAIRFDDSQSHQVYDMAYAANSSSESSTDASGATTTAPGAGASGGTGGTGASRSRSRSQERGVAGHEVVVHRVDGLRVTPHWTQGDTLSLEVQLTHAAPTTPSGMTTGDARAAREFEFSSTVQVSFDEWQSVANVGDGGEELQVRVSWR